MLGCGLSECRVALAKKSWPLPGCITMSGKQRIAKDELERRAQVVSQTFAGIQPPCEAFYIVGILYAASRSLEAFSRYDDRCAVGASGDEMLAAVQEAVTHAGGLSRYFWPPRPKSTDLPNFALLIADRGKKLRAAFNLNDQSPLNNRRLRNTFEHFEENVDMFLLEVSAGKFFPQTVLAPNIVTDSQVDHYFRLLDADAQSIVLLGNRFDFEPIREAVWAIHTTAEEMVKRGYRLHG